MSKSLRVQDLRANNLAKPSSAVGKLFADPANVVRLYPVHTGRERGVSTKGVKAVLYQGAYYGAPTKKSNLFYDEGHCPQLQKKGSRRFGGREYRLTLKAALKARWRVHAQKSINYAERAIQQIEDVLESLL
jgi:hypothetical protein